MSRRSSQKHTLSALENVFANTDKDTLLRGGHLIRLLNSLAYYSALFDRACEAVEHFRRRYSMKRDC